MEKSAGVEKAYEAAKAVCLELGVDTDKAIEDLSKISVSLHCWQGDDAASPHQYYSTSQLESLS